MTTCQNLEPFPKLLYLVNNLYISRLPNTRQLNIIGIIMHLKFVESFGPDKMLIRQEMLATYMPIHAVKPYGQNRWNGTLFVAPRFMIPDD